MTTDCLVIGGGVVGLSIAWSLARRGLTVRLLERDRPGREASWAGAGILPPANETALHPIEKLRAWSNSLHPRWSRELLDATGIDNEFHICGGLYLARSQGEAAALAGMAAVWAEEGIERRKLTRAELARLEPRLAHHDDLRAAYLAPGEAQLRNPRHLQALEAVCRSTGVIIEIETEATGFRTSGSRVTAVATSQGDFAADVFVVAGGSWSGQLLAAVGRPLAVIPIRGQMILFRAAERFFERIVNEGPRYLVPRRDGHVLCGSTEEEAGFDKSVTPEEMARLEEFAYDWAPELRGATIEARWAGLRPSTYDGFPFIGRMPDRDNLLVATGHFRSGLHLSPATAEIVASLVAGEHPPVDLTLFGVGR